MTAVILLLHILQRAAVCPPPSSSERQKRWCENQRKGSVVVGGGEQGEGVAIGVGLIGGWMVGLCGQLYMDGGGAGASTRAQR